MKAWLLIIFTGVTFGSLGLSTKDLTTRGVSPLVCAAIPFAMTALIVLLRHSYRASTPWLEALALGGVNAAVPALLFNFGFNRLPASIVTLTMASGPVFTALTAHIAFHDDRFSGAKVTGLALSFSGVVLLAGLPVDGGNGSPIAFVVTLIGAALSGASLVWVRRIVVRHDPMTVLAPMMAGAAVVTGIASGLGGYPLWSPQVDAGELAQLVAMGVLGVLTYLSALKASQLAPASRVGLMGYLVPLVGVTGGVLLFAEPFTGRLALGGLLVLGGVALVGWQNRRVAITTAG